MYQRNTDATDTNQTFAFLSNSHQQDVRNHSITIPRLSTGTTKEAIVLTLMQVLSDFQVCTFPGFMFPSPIQLWSSENTHQKEVPLTDEGVTIATTDRSHNKMGTHFGFKDIYHLVKPHSDNSNCNNSIPSRKMIVTFKHVGKDERLTTIVGYTRSSVHSMMISIETHKTVSKKIMQKILNQFKEDRRSIGPAYTTANVNQTDAPSDHELFSIFPSMLSIKTNCDPTAAYQSVIFGVLLIHKRFKLQYGGVGIIIIDIGLFGKLYVSVQLCFCVLHSHEDKHKPCQQ